MACDVFLVGSPYSGSTHLGALMAANFDAFYAGEVAHLPHFVERYGLYDNGLGCLPCAIDKRPCPVWTASLVSAVESAGPGGCMDVIRRLTGHSVVVDGSKWPEWLRLAVHEWPSSSVPVVVLITARSPVTWALSASAATGASLVEVVQWWRDIYVDAVRTVNRLSLPAVVVRNEDLRARPSDVLGTLAGVLGVPVPASVASPVKAHSLAGNLFVHKGYSAATYELRRSLGLPPARDNEWDAEAWASAAVRESAFELLRPRTPREAVNLVQTVFDCPGLTDIAGLLGYQVAREAVNVLDSCNPPNECLH